MPHPPIIIAWFDFTYIKLHYHKQNISYLDEYIARLCYELHIVCFVHFTPGVLAATLVYYSSGEVAQNS